MIAACLFDMDGVVRQWDPSVAAGIEAAHGLPTGALRRTAFGVPEYADSLRGRVTGAQWWAAGAAELERRHPGVGAAAVIEWRRDTGRPDPEVVDLVHQAGRAVPVALLSNAHDGLREDLRRLDLDGVFDVVICSAEVGLVKPDPALYRYAADRLGAPPASCFFTDDLTLNVMAAREVGMDAEVFAGAAALAAQLADRLPPAARRRKGHPHAAPLHALPPPP